MNSLVPALEPLDPLVHPPPVLCHLADPLGRVAAHVAPVAPEVLHALVLDLLVVGEVGALLRREVALIAAEFSIAFPGHFGLLLCICAAPCNQVIN